MAFCVSISPRAPISPATIKLAIDTIAAELNDDRRRRSVGELLPKRLRELLR